MTPSLLRTCFNFSLSKHPHYLMYYLQPVPFFVVHNNNNNLFFNQPAAKATARQFKDVIAPTSMEFAKLPRSLRTPPTNPAVEVMSSAPLPSDSKDLNLLTKIFKPPATKKRRYSKKKVAANQDQIEQTEPQKSPERNETEQTETPDKFQAQAVRTTTSASTQNEVVEDIPKKAPAGVNGICDFGEEGDSSDTSEPAPSKENVSSRFFFLKKGNKILS